VRSQAQKDSWKITMYLETQPHILTGLVQSVFPGVLITDFSQPPLGSGF
jgi:hypothetical protein